MNIFKKTGKKWLYSLLTPLFRKIETNLIATGRLLSNQQCLLDSEDINDYEFKIFSQRGEDGIIQYLIKNLFIENDTFIEFGVENYMESNTRFLMMNNNWRGFVIDGSEGAMKTLRKREWFWAYDLIAEATFIDKNNINKLLDKSGFKNIGLLSIDIDGNDYWIFKEIELSTLNPSIIIVEYNALFGSDRFISVPYRNDFNRTKAHYSNLFFGASLPALTHLAEEKGYELIGCNIAGTNAFFIRRDLLNSKVRKITVKQAFKEDKSRQSRDKDYKLSLKSGDEKLNLIKGLEVINILTDQNEKL